MCRLNGLIRLSPHRMWIIHFIHNRQCVKCIIIIVSTIVMALCVEAIDNADTSISLKIYGAFERVVLSFMSMSPTIVEFANKECSCNCYLWDLLVYKTLLTACNIKTSKHLIKKKYKNKYNRISTIVDCVWLSRAHDTAESLHRNNRYQRCNACVKSKATRYPILKAIQTKDISPLKET